MQWRAPWLRNSGRYWVLTCVDVLAIVISYLVASKIRLGVWQFFGNSTVGIGIIWLGFSYLSGRYSTSESKSVRIEMLSSQTLMTFFGSLSVYGIAGWSMQRSESLLNLRGFAFTVFVLLSLTSYVLVGITKSCTRAGSKGYVIVSSDDLVETLREEIKTLRREDKEWQTLFAGSAEEMMIDISRNNVRTLAVGSSVENNNSYREECMRLRKGGVRIISLISWAEEVLQRIPPELIDNQWLLFGEGSSLRPGTLTWRIKRLGDIAFGIPLFLASIPIVLVAGTLVWLEDGHSMFYSQTRTGLYGRSIKIWKLRSMKVDAEKSGKQWSVAGDKRITKVGKVLRMLRIDELPQLYSVLTGEMSLIGPRPERPEIEKELRVLIPNYDMRHLVRPGLSGWSQVSFGYGASAADSRNKLAYDLYYLRNGGILMDLMIFVKTIRLLVNVKGWKAS